MYPLPQPILWDRLARTYTFDEQMVEEIYDGLLMEGKIQPMIGKRPAEVGRVMDPRYCHYHQFVTHPTNECYTLKNAIQDLVDANVLSIWVKEVP